MNFRSQLRMNVCMISPSFPSMKCGIADYTWRLVQYLAMSGKRVFLITSDNEKIRDYISKNSFANILVFPIIKRWGYLSMLNIYHKVIELNPDIVHLQYQWWAYNRLSMITFFPLVLKLSKKRSLVITTVHDLMGPYFFPKAIILRRFAFKTMISYSDKATVIDRVDEERLKQMAPSARKKIHYVPIGANVLPDTGEHRVGSQSEKFSARASSNGEIKICNYGYLFPHKGLETLLESIALLKVKGYRVRLIVIGGDSIERATNLKYPNFIKGLIKKMNLSSTVEILGFCNPEQVSAMLSSSDLCVLPFNDGVREARGTFITAMAHKLAIVTTRGNKIPRSLIDGENVILVPPLNPQKLAQAIADLIDNPQLRAKLQQNSYKLYKQSYTWEFISEQTDKIYRELHLKNN